MPPVLHPPPQSRAADINTRKQKDDDDDDDDIDIDINHDNIPSSPCLWVVTEADTRVARHVERLQHHLDGGPRKRSSGPFIHTHTFGHPSVHSHTHLVIRPFIRPTMSRHDFNKRERALQPVGGVHFWFGFFSFHACGSGHLVVRGFGDKTRFRRRLTDLT